MATSDSPHRPQDLRLDTSIKDFGSNPPPNTKTGNTHNGEPIWDKPAGEAPVINGRGIDGRVINSNTLTLAPSLVEEVIFTDEPVHSAQPSQASSVDEYLMNRRPSIVFNNQITLDSGKHQSMDQPLQKPIKVRPRGRSLLQAISDEKKRTARAHSESDSTHYDPVTGQPLPRYSMKPRDDREQPHVGELRHPLLSSTVDELARESQQDLPASMTSQSTISPGSEEIHTPTDQREDFILSPSSISPPQHAVSYEETTPWQRKNSRRLADRAQTGDFFNRPSSMRNALRQSSRPYSRRSGSGSTKSPMSAASSFLRGFSISNGGDPADGPTEPDAEGLTIGENYVLGKQIGFGGFSTIHEVTQVQDSGEQRKLAVKVVRRSLKGKGESENQQVQAEFEHEVELWRFLKHPRILPLEAVCKTDEATYCFIPLNTGGTLFDLVRSNRSGVTSDLAKRYSYQLASALRYLHRDARVAHRDVKIENCLLDNTTNPGNVRLCDFGMAEWISREDSMSTSGPPSPDVNSADRPPPKTIGPSDTSSSAFTGGSLEYAAPEILRPEEYCEKPERAAVSPAVDIWALGVCIYTMVVGRRPFSDPFQPRITMAILAGDWNREKLVEKGGYDVLELVEGCLEMDAEKRWDADMVVECAWLKDVVDGSDESDNSFGYDWKL